MPGSSSQTARNIPAIPLRYKQKKQQDFYDFLLVAQAIYFFVNDRFPSVIF